MPPPEPNAPGMSAAGRLVHPQELSSCKSQSEIHRASLIHASCTLTTCQTQRHILHVNYLLY